MRMRDKVTFMGRGSLRSYVRNQQSYSSGYANAIKPEIKERYL